MIPVNTAARIVMQHILENKDKEINLMTNNMEQGTKIRGCNEGQGGFDPVSFKLAVKQSIQYNRWLGRNMLVLIYKRTKARLYQPTSNSLKSICDAFNKSIHGEERK